MVMVLGKFDGQMAAKEKRRWEYGAYTRIIWAWQKSFLEMKRN